MLFALMSQKSKGFTLLELMVVIAIMGFIVAIVGGTIGRLGGVQVRSAANTIASALEMARDQSINSSARQAFEIDIQAGRIKVGNDQWQELPEGLEYRLKTVTEQIIDQNRAIFYFFPDGSSTGGHIEVGVGGLSTFVNIDWLTGRIEVVDNE